MDGLPDSTIRLSSGAPFSPGLFLGAFDALFGAARSATMSSTWAQPIRRSTV